MKTIIYRTLQLTKEQGIYSNYTALNLKTSEIRHFNGISLIQIINILNDEGYCLSAIEGQGDYAKYYFTNVIFLFKRNPKKRKLNF